MRLKLNKSVPKRCTFIVSNNSIILNSNYETENYIFKVGIQTHNRTQKFQTKNESSVDFAKEIKMFSVIKLAIILLSRYVKISLKIPLKRSIDVYF